MSENSQAYARCKRPKLDFTRSISEYLLDNLQFTYFTMKQAHIISVITISWKCRKTQSLQISTNEHEDFSIMPGMEVFITGCQQSCGKVMFSVVSVIVSTRGQTPTPFVQPSQPPHTHYEACTVGKRAVSIELKCLLVSI